MGFHSYLQSTLLALFLLTVSTYGCSNDHKDKILSSEELASVYADLLSVGVTTRVDSEALAREDSVLAGYRISRGDFQRSLATLSKDPDLWPGILKHVIARLDSAAVHHSTLRWKKKRSPSAASTKALQ